MNKVILIGRLTRDPAVIHTQGERPVTVVKFTLSTERKYKKEQESDFIGCVAFGSTAKFINKYFKKGMKMAIVGHIQSSSYKKSTGQKVYTTDVVVDEVEFVERKSASSIDEQSSPKGSSSGIDFINVTDSLPFVN